MSAVVTLFGSSLPVEQSPEYATAYACGAALARSGFTVCNGGYGGTMQASARGAQEAGGMTIGVTVASWARKPNSWVRQEVKTASLTERLMKLVELGSAYGILPGGTGTLLEFACVLEFVNKGVIGRKPIVLVGDFWNGVLETLRNEPGVGDTRDGTRLVKTVHDARELAAYLKSVLPAV